MRIEEIRELLLKWDDASSQRDRATAEALTWSAPAGFDNVALRRENYAFKLAEVLFRLQPRRHLTIGGLIGTTESLLVRCYPPILERLVICDLDIPSYNPDRDMGAYCYRNVCGTRYGAFGGQFVYVRDDSKRRLAKQAVAALGPFHSAFIDGEHSRDAVVSDMTLAAECLTPGGVMLVHDLELPGEVPTGYRDWIARNSTWRHVEIPASHFDYGLGLLQRGE